MKPLVWMAGSLSVLLLGSAAAQTLRDPTLEPAAPAVGSVVPGADSPEVSSLSVIVVNGQARVIMGTRLYAPGQKLGQARIERITETEVWLREGAVLRKVPRYQGIERRSVPPRSTADCAAGTTMPAAASQPGTLGAPCPAAR